MSNFSKNWEAPPKKSHAPSGPLKPAIENAMKQINAQTMRLDQASVRLNDKDRQLFDKVVDSYSKGNSQRAMMLANELSEVRKLNKRVTQIKLALESISLRLMTVKDYGDFVSTVTPAISILRGVQSSVYQVVPEAERGFSSLSESLSSIVTEAGTSSGVNISFASANEEADRILSEAAGVAEMKLKDKFPELPADVKKEGIQL